jgi:arginyl-tRNA synthetase
LRQARLALVSAVGQALRNGLAVLGLAAPEQM